MSYIPHAAGETDLPSLQRMKEAFGFVPNFFLGQTSRPDLIDAEVQLVDGILVKEGALTRQQKEYVFLVCSAANLSTYCVTAHCEMVRMMGVSGPGAEEIALDHTVADLPIAMKALLSFAIKLNNRPTAISRRDIDALRTYGYTDQQILETVLTVGLAKFGNFVAFGLGTVPDFDPVNLIPSGTPPAGGGAASSV